MNRTIRRFLEDVQEGFTQQYTGRGQDALAERIGFFHVRPLAIDFDIVQNIP